MRSRLLKIAQQQTESLKKRDEVIGIGLYGSVAYNKVTPFSDLDMFIITTESEHYPAIEHRLCDGVRADFIWESFENWQKIQYADPSYIPWYLIKALLLGSDDMIIYDPQGIIKLKRDSLRQEITYEEFFAHTSALNINYISEELQVAISHEEEGRFEKAWKHLSGSLVYLFMILTDITNSKKINEALQIINIPGLEDCVKTIINLRCEVNGITAEFVRNLYNVDKAYWEYQLESIWSPLRQSLIKQGVQFPEKLEVIGELILAYGGVRVYELGRVVDEHNFSLKWAEDDIKQGDLLDAMNKILYEGIINNSEEKWMRIDSAITSAGYDTGMIIRNVLDSEEFQKRTEEAKKALRSSSAVEVYAGHTKQFISAIYEYLRLVSEYWISHYPKALQSMPELFTLSRDEIVQKQRNREKYSD